MSENKPISVSGQKGMSPAKTENPFFLKEKGVADHLEQTSFQEEMVAELAYELWTQAGKPPGDIGEFWTQAEEKIAHSI